MEAQSSDLFYQALSSFKQFDEITNSSHYGLVPGDWGIFITDIQGSTKAIEAGRYKDVNTLGVASIVAAQNAMKGVEFPYVFGGDGATFVIPPSYVENVKGALDGIRTLAQTKFNMVLRVGLIFINEMSESSARVEVAKFEIDNSQTIAIFRGGGLTHAEVCVKSELEKYTVENSEKNTGDLSGLSCRWNPIPSKRGTVLSFLAVARPEKSSAIYQAIIAELTRIMNGKLENANPINLPDMTYRTVGQCYDDEIRYHDSKWSFRFLFRFLEICAAVLVFKFKIPPLVFNQKKYSEEMRVQSDYRKFDDMLRLIIDCSTTQVDEIESVLKMMYKKGEIFYGLHTSDTALMTCFVNSVNEGDHFHFVDGGDGGYAMAAKQLKGQMKSSGQ